MGDRVLFQVVNKDRSEFSPVVYGHNLGYRWRNIVKDLEAQMATRRNDVQYIGARLVEIASRYAGTGGALGLGMWNIDHVLTADDSHGDAGCVLIDATTFETEQVG